VDKDLKSNTLDELEEVVVGLGQNRYVAGYIFSFIHTRGATEFDAITPLSKLFRRRLAGEGYYISTLRVAEKSADPDGTIKYVFCLADVNSTAEHAETAEKKNNLTSANSAVTAVNRIESVLLPASTRLSPTARPGLRRTLCVSTQVGCGMDCVFCATGRLGFARNLTAAEIVEQVNVIDAESDITNVVFMGMGEPLANYDAVLKAIRILNHPKGKNIGIRHLTISTCGIPEGIERLADEDIKPRLAISLNAPTDVIRRKLMPVSKKYPLDRLFEAVNVYQRKTHNRVTFEYCLIKDFNDTVSHARLLVKRLRGTMSASTRRLRRGGCNVNLIEYNPHAGGKMKPSSPETIERFADVLRESGFETTIRIKFGQAVNAACGQLGAGTK
jgi:23S rRNA (adenine2503-C2)-methyltransferase